MKTLNAVLLLSLLASSALAHHSVLRYGGKQEIVISGGVAAAKFAFPHSIYKIRVAAKTGNTEGWILSTEDPRDAERLGFADELKALKIGNRV